MKNKLIYGWLILLTILILIILFNSPKYDDIDIGGMGGSLDDLWEEVGHIRVKANTLHKMINETSWDNYVDRCLGRYGWDC